MAEAIAEEYRSSLGDLNFNSKPHINMLTMLAEENVKYAPVIVKTIVEHVVKVPPNLKLPSLYLVDSIMKNVGGQYVDLFCDHLVTLFSSVFEKVEEVTRSQLYKLRQTWNDILPKKVLYGIDYNVNLIDPAWPITAQVPPVVQVPPQKSSIHVNPKFLGTPKQATVPLQNPSKPKPNLLKKNNLEAGNKEKEIMEILKKQEELGRQLKEKKEQVKALEMKKLEMAAKQKKNNFTSSILIQQNAQVKINNNNPRDPRLKKTNTPVVNDKSNASQATLQSVVVVPNVKLPAQENITGNGTPLQKPSSKGDKPTPGNKTFHSKVSPPPINRRTTHTVKKPVKSAVDNSKQTEKPPKDVHSATRISPNKSFKIPSKKHSLNADEKTLPNPKKVCKPTSKSKHPIQSEAAPVPVSEKRVDAPLLFGSEDKDYRQRPAVTPNVRQWTPPDVAPPPNTRVPQEPFYPKQVPDIPSSEPKESFFPRDGIVPPAGSVTRRIPEDCYHAAKTTFNVDRAENENFFQLEPNTFKKVDEQSSFALNNEQPELSYSLAPKPVSTHRVSPPPPKHFTLDGINYTLYFVGKHAFVLLDSNEPREVIFRGPPRLVHIEGQNQPILLGFDGRVVDFHTEGQRNTMHFGTPSREVYVNDLPYEAQFGGSPITVILQDNKPHWVKIDGPLPQVVLVVPPPELYEEFQRSRGSELSMERRDVDMRMTAPSHPLVKTTILPESTKDVDWRQLPAQVPSWEGPPKKAVVEPYNEYEPPPNGRNFQEYPNPPMAPNGPWNEGNSRMMSDRGPPPPNRNLDEPWPRPGFHPRIQHERPMRPSPPHNWDLPPPPKIPANLVQTLANRPPSTWNPLPPPPSFPGQQIHDSVPTTMPSLLPPPVSSNSILPAMQPSLPDVGSIYDKLVAAGIIPKAVAAVATAVKDEPKVIKAEDPIKEVKVKAEVKKEPEDSKELPEPEITLSPKCLRVHYPAVLTALYRGSQCATCGMRFKEIQSEKYSRHLDWHFRMNRKEKDGAKKAYSRRLFYSVKDWVQFKEIEEKEERTPSYFELQAGGLSKTEEQKIQSVPASECESEKCSVCSEQFQLFWVEEEEEWHLRHAVRHDGEVYHPMCYEDFTRAEEITKRMEEAKAKAEAEELAKKLEEEAAEKAKAEKEAAEKAEKEAAEKEAAEKAEKEAAEKAEKEAAEKAEKEAAEKAEKEAAEKVELEAAEKAIAEGAAKVKEEPLSPEGETECTSQEDVDVNTESVKEESDKSTLVPGETKSKPAPRHSLDSFFSSDVDSDSFEDEFHPPPPDPRFQNLPKVERGKELSALCTIM